MKPVIVFVLAAVFAVGVSQDHHGARTFGTSLNVESSHNAHHHDHHHQHGQHHDHQHQLPTPAVSSPAAVVPSETVKIQTVPVLIGQIVNFPVVETVPQQTAVGSISGVSGAVSSLVHTQQQVVGNITAGFGSVVTSVLNPVVALLRNASIWLNRTAQANIPSPHHDHAAVAVHNHGSHNAHGHNGVNSHPIHGVAASHDHVSHIIDNVHAHHGNGQVSPVGTIPVFIINGQQGQQVPTATVGAPVPLSSADGQFSEVQQTPVLGSQLFSFGVPAPVAALGNFLASAAAPILGTAAPVTSFGAAVPTAVIASTTFMGTSSGNVTFAVPLNSTTTVPHSSVPLAAVTSSALPPLSNGVPPTTAAPVLPPVLGPTFKSATV